VTIALQLSGVRKTYRVESGAVAVLKDVTLSVAHGEILALIGPSGCGKTTLLRIIAGLTTPDDGTVRLPAASPEAPQRLGLVSQPLALFPWLTCRRNVEFGLKCVGIPRAERRRRADAYLSAFALSAYAEFYPHQLSGGMRQRLALARALVVNPTVLLLDEPFGALDSYTRSLAQDFLNSVLADYALTTILVTHDVREALYLADRVVVCSSRPAEIIHTVTLPERRPRSRAITYSELFTARVRDIEACLRRGGDEPQRACGAEW
jgi:ABC-type nitrate/sulfonate/bicarbonate transport system ATPase subunit